MTILSGLFRITRQAELRHLPSGEPVCNLSLAYNWGIKKDENGFLPSTFIEAGLWGKRAEAIHQYLEKGKQIFAVLEDLHIEHFNKADGTPGVKLAARVQSIEFVSTPRTEGEVTRQERQAARPAATPGVAGSGFDDFDDSIPF